MGEPVRFAGANKLLGPPRGTTEEQVRSMPVFSNGACCVSCWELTPEEVLAVIATRRVWVSVYSGASQPPVFIGSEDTVRAVAVDYGPVWRREEP